MMLDDAVALSLLENLPRVGLIPRLQADDPQLLERAARDRARAATLREQAAQTGVHPLAWNDRRFPSGLLAIGDCPPLLWYRGVLECLDAPMIAIVGSRAASAVSLELATQLGADLAARGVTVVSGLARGVDSAAHRGALRNGRTIAVLGSGLSHIYPAEHASLARDIANTGLVVSEYPPDAAPLPYRFPLRNRLISGMSRAVIVIEASEQSGSLITAACALEQGREVMAVPGNVLSGRNRGGHALIRDGARIVECADDVLEELGLAEVSPGGDGREMVRSATGSVACKDPVLRAMDHGEPYDIDALVRRSGLDPSRLLPRLSDLELRGLIGRAEGGRFVRRG